MPSNDMHDPITRAWVQQLNHQVNLFLRSYNNGFENQLLPNEM
jgi:hypothetical protein